MELDIIKLLSERDNYYRYKQLVKEHTVTKECNQILRDMDEYYTKHEDCAQIDWDKFKTWFTVVQHGNWSAEVQSDYVSIFKRVAEHETPDKEIVKHFIGLDAASRLFDESALVAEGSKRGFDDILRVVHEYEEKVSVFEQEESHSIILTGDSILDELTEDTDRTTLSWGLSCLNKAIGAIGQGDLIGVFGRPDAGKTTLLAYEAVNFARQCEDGEHVIWLNNEEAAKKVRRRYIQSGLGITVKELLSDPDGYAHKFDEEIGLNKIVLVDSSGITEGLINKVIKDYPPRVIIVDQLAKLVLSSGEKLNEAQQGLALARLARGLAKRVCPLIFTGWADGQAEGVKYMDMTHWYGSKTGIQGEADALIAIGRSNDEPTIAARKNRYIHIPKNKICNGDPNFINGKFEIQIQPEIARWTE